MNVLLISQCDKRALVESRRILDQFAERRGERTWQTPITEAGLHTLRKLLRKTARKNTAVACHWIRGRDHSELLWIVGDAGRFNPVGAVPTNTTERNVLRHADENDWHSLEDIRQLATLGSLLHDLGKATVAFQERLRGQRTERNRIRHEWVSLRLFEAFVGDDDDERWLTRLAAEDAWTESIWLASARLRRDALDGLHGDERHPFRRLPPLAAAVGWLVLTHHRLPMQPFIDADGRMHLGRRVRGSVLGLLDDPLAQVAHDWNEVSESADREQIQPYWAMAGELPITGARWRKQAAKAAARLLERQCRDASERLLNPYVMHLARLALMLADHHYSSLPKESPQRVDGDGKTRLYANTDPKGSLKQPLDEHLLGVAHGARQIVQALPGFERHLPRLLRHRGLRKRSADPRFAWQDKAADTAESIRQATISNGAFVVNMASTGCGKTLANLRILNALADPQLGLRATYTLGLRALTLQTGRSYRENLQLGDDDLAILVGGHANRLLFEFHERQAESTGSASTQTLLDEVTHVRYEGPETEHPLLSRALVDPTIRRLISAPVLVATVDHLVPATESTRAGRQIAPMLRLLSSELIIDELDDYDLDDLPALTRLVHWAGMLGTRIVLSSATLPPALVEGMYLAYRAGRQHYRRNRGEAPLTDPESIEVPCLWVDEFGTTAGTCTDAASLRDQHARFVSRRVTRLREAPPLRRAEILPFEVPAGTTVEQHYEVLARVLLQGCVRLHSDHASVDPTSGKRVSFGLIRLANIEPLIGVALKLIGLGAPEGHRIHLCIYHSRFPLVQRSAIENQLDQAFDRRREAGNGVFRLPDVRTRIDRSPEPNQMFIVLASPVCEVGRDWDGDWAIAEPSSMRSLIQLAGRVQRHRARPVERPNILILERNLKGLARGQPSDPPLVFVRPGFERGDRNSPFRLLSPRVSRLLIPEEFETLTAIPRIQPRAESEWETRKRLVDLEHGRMVAAMLPRASCPESLRPPSEATMERDEAAWSWLKPQSALTGLLQQQQRFRDDSGPRDQTLVALPDDEEEALVWNLVEERKGAQAGTLYTPIDGHLIAKLSLAIGPRIEPWTRDDLTTLLSEQARDLNISLRECAEKMATVEVPDCAQGWEHHPWIGFRKIGRGATGP